MSVIWNSQYQRQRSHREIEPLPFRYGNDAKSGWWYKM